MFNLVWVNFVCDVQIVVQFNFFACECLIFPTTCIENTIWDFFRMNDAKAETPVLWPSHLKSWLIGKDSDTGRDWGQEEKGTTGDEIARWHHRLDGHEFGWTPGVGDGQGGLACCSSWCCKESETTEWLNWTELKNYVSFILYIDKIFDKYICIFKYMHHEFYFQRVSLPAHYRLLLTLHTFHTALVFF